VKLGGDDRFVHAFGLVHDEDRGRRPLAQRLRDALVLGREAGAPVDDEEHHVGFRDRFPRLARHLREDALLGDGLEATRIHHDEGLGAQAPLAVVPVAREAGQVGDERVA
jgi:hypothetical protein